MAMMYHESGLDSSVLNKKGSGAVGLIQFMPDTARRMGTTPEALQSMSNVEQLDWVYKYFMPYKSRIKSYTDLYLVAFYPIALEKGEDFVCGSERSLDWAHKVCNENEAVDLNKDGLITVGEFRQWTLMNLPGEVKQRLGI
jgi:hypothetical protein